MSNTHLNKKVKKCSKYETPYAGTLDTVAKREKNDFIRYRCV